MGSVRTKLRLKDKPGWSGHMTMEDMNDAREIDGRGGERYDSKIRLIDKAKHG